MSKADQLTNDTRLQIRQLIQQHCLAPRQGTLIPGLTLFNCASATEPKPSIYEPRLCLVFQGAKRVLLGASTHDIGAGDMLLATIDLPVTAFVTQATDADPHLALVLSLDRVRIASILADMAGSGGEDICAMGLVVTPQQDDVLASVARLLELLARPADIPMLFPLIEREIVYRLLNGRLGGILSAFAAANPRLSQITRATRWIQDHYDQPFKIADLAAYVAMSATSLHRHFRAVTSMTPLEYRREVRLAEARRHLLAGTHRAGEAGAAVGYESPAQFSREYRRSFGQSPVQSVRLLRQT